MIVGECIDQILDRYRLIRLLGQSGSSEVYLGEHKEQHIPVAIKMLHGRFARSDLETFLAQARTLSRLEHPHIARVFDYGIEDDTPYLVLAYAPHGNMRQRYPRGTRLSLDTVVFYVKQVAAALQYIHERRLIHRDIKPHNMLLGPGHLILLSYEWLSGEWPFRGSFYEVARQHMFDAAPSLREDKGIDIAPAVEEVVLKAIAKDAGKRFGSVREFAEALECASYEAPVFAFQARPGRQFISPFPFTFKATLAL